jgi:RNA polymerase sigma-70 factor (ECF subfamily)
MEQALTEPTAEPVAEPVAKPGALMRLRRALAPSSSKAPAFEDVLRQHQGIVRGFLRRLCNADAIADDIAQETFLKVRKGLPQYRGEGSVASWVLRIAYREFLAQRRKRGVADVLVEGADELDALDGERAERGDRLMERDVRRALRVLSDDERVAVAACFFEDLSHEEAALALGIPLGTLKSQVARAKEKLRAPLDAYRPKPPPELRP